MYLIQLIKKIIDMKSKTRNIFLNVIIFNTKLFLETVSKKQHINNFCFTTVDKYKTF